MPPGPESPASNGPQQTKDRGKPRGTIRVRRFTDYERPQPGWMDPLAAELADLADAELQWTLHPEKREAALFAAMEVVLERIREEEERLEHTPSSADRQRRQLRHLHDQARRAMDQVKDVRFQGIGPMEH